MKKAIWNISNGILAGLMITIGCAVFLACESKVVGAIFFSVALLTICYFKFALFTGKVGFIIEKHQKDDFSVLLLALLGNFIGTLVFGLLIKISLPSLFETAQTLCNNKLTVSLWKVLIRAVFCGVLMYVAVYVFNKNQTPVGILFAIPVFILSGFEHSIADMGYFVISGIVDVKAFLFILTVIIGNALGSFIIPLLSKLKVNQ